MPVSYRTSPHALLSSVSLVLGLAGLCLLALAGVLFLARQQPSAQWLVWESQGGVVNQQRLDKPSPEVLIRRANNTTSQRLYTISPDGWLVAYVRGKSGQETIQLQRVDG